MEDPAEIIARLFSIMELETSSSSSRSRQHSPQRNEPNATVWVFGYGSLCWYPGFEFQKCVTGYIRGYVRRFWQGNTTHRGTKEKPGRVATLVEEDEGMTWGCAYKITGNTALEYLKDRECNLGGYVTEFTKFYPRISSPGTEISGEAFPVLLYIATEMNCHWMGEAAIPDLACQILESNGPSGHNVEYVVRLADFMRDEIPEAFDEHLFDLERLIRELIKEKGMEMCQMMGPQPLLIRRDSHENVLRPTSFEFTSRVPEVKLRCLHI